MSALTEFMRRARARLWGAPDVEACIDYPHVDVVAYIEGVRSVYALSPGPATLRMVIQVFGVNVADRLDQVLDAIASQVDEDEGLPGGGESQRRQLRPLHQATGQLRSRGMAAVALLTESIDRWGPDMADWPEHVREDVEGPEGMREEWLGGHGGVGGKLPMLYAPSMIWNQMCAYYNWRDAGWTTDNLFAEQLSDFSEHAGDHFEEGLGEVEEIMEEAARKAGEAAAAPVKGLAAGLWSSLGSIVVLGGVGYIGYRYFTRKRQA